MKTPLIDNLSSNTTEINGKWWIAKPMADASIINKLKIVWLVITGKATAVHFKSDEIENQPTN